MQDYQGVISRLQNTVSWCDETLITRDLKDRVLKVFFNKHVFNPERPRLRSVNPELSFEWASANLLSGWLDIVDIANADRRIVELFIGADWGGPPLLDLEYGHIIQFKFIKVNFKSIAPAVVFILFLIT